MFWRVDPQNFTEISEIHREIGGQFGDFGGGMHACGGQNIVLL